MGQPNRGYPWAPVLNKSNGIRCLLGGQRAGGRPGSREERSQATPAGPARALSAGVEGGSRGFGEERPRGGAGSESEPQFPHMQHGPLSLLIRIGNGKIRKLASAEPLQVAPASAPPTRHLRVSGSVLLQAAWSSWASQLMTPRSQCWSTREDDRRWAHQRGLDFGQPEEGEPCLPAGRPDRDRANVRGDAR